MRYFSFRRKVTKGRIRTVRRFFILGDICTMNYEILEAIGQIAREKNVSRELVIETLQAGLLSAAKKRFGTAVNIEVSVDNKTGEVEIYARKTVVSEVKNPALEIPLEEARKLNPEAQVGDEVKKELNFADFGRGAVQAAKQILIQRVKEAERERIYREFQEKVGDILIGSVQQINHGDLIVNLGRAEGIIPITEQIRKERYRQGDTIRAYLVDVTKTTKGPQIILSRTHPRFLERLFQLEVPEIYEGIVQIKTVAREAGERAKIAVASTDARIDPVGACVGMKGSRVQAVVRELNNEQVDIIQWSPDPAVFLARALSPAIVSKVDVDEPNHRMIAVVPGNQLSLAIGKAGQNVRLASMLTGWRVDIISEEEYRERKEAIPLSALKGIGEKLAKKLADAGIKSVQDLAKRNLEELIKIPGIGKARAEILFQQTKEILGSKMTSTEMQNVDKG